jgi:hypothetical protein
LQRPVNFSERGWGGGAISFSEKKIRSPNCIKRKILHEKCSKNHLVSVVFKEIYHIFAEKLLTFNKNKNMRFVWHTKNQNNPVPLKAKCSVFD